MSSVTGQPNPFQPRLVPAGKRSVPAFGGNLPESAKTESAAASADTVDLKGKISTEAETTTPETKPPTGWKNKIFNDKARLATGFVLEDVVPPLLGFAFVAGPIGWAVTLGSLPLSYASGKLGRRIASGVNKDNLTGSMKSFHDFRESFRNRHELKESGALINKWNTFIDDALNIRSGQYKALAGALGGFVKVNANSRIGKILSSKQFLKANIYHDVAQADSVGKAVKAGAKGGASYWFYQGVQGIGLAMEKASNAMWGPFKWPFKGIGWLLANLPLLKTAKDLALPQKSKAA